MKRKELDVPSSAAAGAPQEEDDEETSDLKRETKRVLPGQSVLEHIGEGTVKIGMAAAACVMLCWLSCLYITQALD